MTEKKVSFSLMMLVVLLGVFVLVMVSISQNNEKNRVSQIEVKIPIRTYHVGDVVNVEVYCSPKIPIKGYEFKVKYDPQILQAIQVHEGNVFSGFLTFYSPGIINNTDGTIINIYNVVIGSGNVTLPGVLASITFQIIGSGVSSITLYDVGITNEISYFPYDVIYPSIEVLGA
jgi:hypothetical protein